MIELSRLDPKVRFLWMAGSLIPATMAGLVAIGLFLADVPIAPWVVGGAAAFIAVTGLILAPARWRSWGYQLTETELIVRFGVVVKTQRWIPRTRVQYVDMIGGPIERALGLRTVTIYTAGTRLADLSIPGLPVQAAELIREDLLSWSREPAPERRADDGGDVGHPGGGDGADQLPAASLPQDRPAHDVEATGRDQEPIDQPNSAGRPTRPGPVGPEHGVPPAPPWTS